jgi:choline dehydrogenase-like flavoprotein
VAIIGEDLPEPHNRVDLDPALADASGIPAPRVSYTLSENSRRMLDHGIARASDVLHAAGARQVSFNPLFRAGGWHLMGTARMGSDPSTSVIDAEGRCHDVPNLYIVDGSVMVTCAGVNPTSTIQAVALYVADGMIRRRA